MCRHGCKHIVDLLRLSFAENKCFRKVLRAAAVSHAGSNSTEITLYVYMYMYVQDDNLSTLSMRTNSQRGKTFSYNCYVNIGSIKGKSDHNTVTKLQNRFNICLYTGRC